MSCYICLEDLSSPVSLPCGHIFCCDCLKRAVQAVQPYSTLHACPTCRAHYSISPLDVTTIPPHLRSHLVPSIRKVYLDTPPKAEKSDTSNAVVSDSSALTTEVARLRAERDALQHNCAMWRKRAEVHSSATLGLLELSRTARDQIVQLCRERDTIQRNYLRLNHDFHRQKAIFQAFANTTLPLQHFGSPRDLSQPQAPSNQSKPQIRMDLSATSVPIQSDGERRRKRYRSEDDDDNSSDTFLHVRPSKVARRIENDSPEESSIEPVATRET